MGDPHVRDRLFVGGEWVRPAGTATVAVENPATEERIGVVPVGTVEDVDRAVAAARAAFGSWSATDVEHRAMVAARIGEGLQARMADVGTLVTEELGMPVNLATMIQVGLPVLTLSSLPEVAAGFSFEERVGNSRVLREAAGVVGAVTPWNYPLHQLAAKLGPALVAGCTVVAKPSELAPLCTFALAEAAEEAGVPPGVVNLVSGGAATGEALVGHPEVDVVSFTGSTAAGRRVGEVAARTVKRVALELGGKSPALLLDDADLEEAVPATVTAAFLNSGQTCSALTRMLVPRARLAVAEDLAARAAADYTPGDPFAPGTRLGPLISSHQRDRVRAAVRRGVSDGARLVTGGAEAPDGLDRGWFVRPTVFSDVDPGSALAQEEIFGPVLAIVAYDDDDEAVEIANRTIYGLAGAVWSADPERAVRVARRLRCGQVQINAGVFNPLAPWGGYRQSGLGRELGRFGLEEYLETKSLQL